MTLFCHEQPETLTVKTELAGRAPGKVALSSHRSIPAAAASSPMRRHPLARREAKVVGFDYSAASLCICSTVRVKSQTA